MEQYLLKYSFTPSLLASSLFLTPVQIANGDLLNSKWPMTEKSEEKQEERVNFLMTCEVLKGLVATSVGF